MRNTRHVSLTVILLALALTAAGASARYMRWGDVDPVRIAINDMQSAAGRMDGGVLNVALEARSGEWRPSGPDGVVLDVAAFAETGRELQNPGPLIRVRSGTEVQVEVTNSLSMPLTMYGLGATRGLDVDSVEIAPGAAHTFSFTAGEPGVYYYAGRTEPVPVLLLRSGYDSQLNGLIVVDPVDAPRRPRDRLFVISWWFGEDSTAVSGLTDHSLMTINGMEWPHTERFDVTQGDSLYWRWANMTVAPHPLHLHGFYYRVDARGDGTKHELLPAAERPMVVTDLLMPGGTLDLAWSPERPGNWVFHCHFAGHMSTMDALNKDRRYPVFASADAHDHAAGPSAVPAVDETPMQHQMGGLVLGIRVRPRGRAAAAEPDARSIRLLMRSHPNVYGEYAGYGYVLGGSADEADHGALPVPGPLLVLERGERVAITLINRTHDPAAVHWHGIELESYSDGVPGWSGQGKSILPMIPVGDSLTIRFTPPRAGTFMYHSHSNEFQQIGSGMYGAIIVREPGQTIDPARDHVMLFSDGGPIVNVLAGPFPPVLLNGSAAPEPMELAAGVPHRLRLINIGAETIVLVRLLDGDQPVTWRAIAKDGFDLPQAQRREQPGVLLFSSGEIYDMEFTPAAAGTLTLLFGPPEEFPGAPPTVAVPVIVR